MIQDNAGRILDYTRQCRTFSTFFKKDRFWDFMIINPENAGVLTREIQLCMIRGPNFS